MSDRVDSTNGFTHKLGFLREGQVVKWVEEQICDLINFTLQCVWSGALIKHYFEVHLRVLPEEFHSILVEC